jgi:hypothetical protein
MSKVALISDLTSDLALANHDLEPVNRSFIAVSFSSGPFWLQSPTCFISSIVVNSPAVPVSLRVPLNCHSDKKPATPLIDRGWPDAAPATVSGNRAARRKGRQNLKVGLLRSLPVLYGYRVSVPGPSLSMDDIAMIGPYSSILSDQGLR